MSVVEIIQAYLRELSAKRHWFALTFFVVAIASLAVAMTWPKTYTSYSTIYADNSGILKPLMEGNAVAARAVDEARMAREVMFQRQFRDEVLQAAGADIQSLSAAQRDSMIESIQGRVQVTNVGRAPVSLIRVAYTDSDPVRAFRIVQKYTTLFIMASAEQKRSESRNAFEFIQNQVNAYQTKLQESEERLSRFKTDNYTGTLSDANARMSRYRTDIERLELELLQLDTEKETLEAELAGQRQVSRDLSEMNALRSRINALQVQLDTLRSVYQENYPDIVQLKTQIADLSAMMDSGNISGIVIDGGGLDNEGLTPLHQQIRSQLSAVNTSIYTKQTQLKSIQQLLAVEMDRIKQINESEAVLAELTRDYNVTQNFYNDMLMRLENARMSVQLNEQEQVVSYKVQESPVIPPNPDGLAFRYLLAGSFLVALAAPVGLLVLYMELDTRIRSEANWHEAWPELLITIPPVKQLQPKRMSGKAYLSILVVLALALYAGATAFYLFVLK